MAGRLSEWPPCLRLWRTWTMQAQSCAACSPSPGTGRGSGELALLVPHGMETMSCASNDSASPTMERLRWGSLGAFDVLPSPAARSHTGAKEASATELLGTERLSLTCTGLEHVKSMPNCDEGRTPLNHAEHAEPGLLQQGPRRPLSLQMAVHRLMMGPRSEVAPDLLLEALQLPPALLLLFTASGSGLLQAGARRPPGGHAGVLRLGQGRRQGGSCLGAVRLPGAACRGKPQHCPVCMSSPVGQLCSAAPACTCKLLRTA